MAHINPEAALLEEMARSNLDEPIVMLNQLKYRKLALDGFGVDGLTGRQAFESYGKAFAKLEPIFGGQLVWMGKGNHLIIGDIAWDIVMLVSYPTRRQFVDMMRDETYLSISPMRAAALLDSRLQEMKQLVPTVLG